MSDPKGGGGFWGYFGMGTKEESKETFTALFPFIGISLPMLGGLSYLIYQFDLVDVSPWILGLVIIFVAPISLELRNAMIMYSRTGIFIRYC